MIESVEITNFKSILSESIELAPLTVFVGANASGKTSVLEAIELGFQLSRVPSEELDRRSENNKSEDEWYTQGGSGPLTLGLSFREAGVITTWIDGDTSMPIEVTGKSRPRQWRYRRIRNGERPKWSTDREDSVRRLQLSPKELAEPSYCAFSQPVMSPTGDGFSSYVAHMALNDPDRFSEIGVELRELIPHFVRARFDRVPVSVTETEFLRIPGETIPRTLRKSYPGDAILFDFDNATGIHARMVSEGTLILFGLLTQILSPDRPRILLLDDIDRGLHPLAQRQLIEALRRFMERFPDLQIIATSHSPYLLDCLHHNEVRLMSLDAEGYSTCKTLSQHPDFEKWRDEMAPGEMWSLFGEKWLAEGTPAQ
jgi:predicted ATPase